MNINELTLKVARHLAQRDVIIRWQNPPSESAAGQIVKTPSGQLIIYIANLEGVESRFKTLIHELSHSRLDANWIPESTDHLRPPASIKRTPEARQRWRSNWREQRAQKQADEWHKFADRNAYKYFTGYQSSMECKLLALLDWRK